MLATLRQRGAPSGSSNMANLCQGAAMLIALHKNATTTPATCLALQQASGTERELAQKYVLVVGYVRKWRHRTTVHDASHTAHRLQTTLRAAQEELVVYLRT